MTKVKWGNVTLAFPSPIDECEGPHVWVETEANRFMRCDKCLNMVSVNKAALAKLRVAQNTERSPL